MPDFMHKTLSVQTQKNYQLKGDAVLQYNTLSLSSLLLQTPDSTSVHAPTFKTLCQAS
jgi:hypothetical protein